MPFDLDAALKEVSEGEIAQYLAKKNGYDYSILREKNFSDADINREMLGMDPQSYEDSITRNFNEQNESDFSRGIKRSIHGMASSGYGMAALGGDVVEKIGEKTGIDFLDRAGESIQDWGMEGYKEHEHEASLLPKDKFSESKLGWGFGTAGELPLFMGGVAVGSAMGGGAGYLVGKKLLKEGIEIAAKKVIKKKAAKIGMKTGVAGTVYPLETGSMYGDLRNTHGVKAPGTSAIFGGLATALEFTGGNVGIIDNLFDAVSTGKGAIVKNIAKELLKNVPAEAMQETGQGLMAILNVVANTDEKLLTKDNMYNLFEAAGVGVMGGVFGVIPKVGMAAMGKKKLETKTPSELDQGPEPFQNIAEQTKDLPAEDDLQPIEKNKPIQNPIGMAKSGAVINEESELFGDFIADEQINQFEKNLADANADIKTYQSEEVRPEITPAGEDIIKRQAEAEQQKEIDEINKALSQDDPFINPKQADIEPVSRKATPTIQKEADIKDETENVIEDVSKDDKKPPKDSPLTQAEVDQYNPVDAVEQHKDGSWLYSLVGNDGYYNSAKVFETEAEAIKGAARHKRLSQGRVANNKLVHDHTNTQVTIPGEESENIREFAAKIPENEIYTEPDDNSYGRENEPHITVKYGLKTNNPGDVKPIVENHPPIKAKMGKVSIFENDKYDVIKVEVDSPELNSLNKKIEKEAEISLPSGETFEYSPHATIAYVKPGEGNKYVGDKTFEGKEIVFNEITVSTRDGQHHQIKLNGKPVQSVTTFEPGQPVSFKTKNRGVLTDTIIKKNGKNWYIKKDEGGKTIVTPKQIEGALPAESVKIGERTPEVVEKVEAKKDKSALEPDIVLKDSEIGRRSQDQYKDWKGPKQTKEEMSHAIDKFFSGDITQEQKDNKIVELKKGREQYKGDPEFLKQVDDKIAELEKPKDNIKGKIGGRHRTGETPLTATGRKTTPFPKTDTSTNRKTQNTLKRIDAWLINNALEEARSREDEFNVRQFENINLKNITQSDKDSAEMYLFGDEQPPVNKSILKPLVDKKPEGLEIQSTKDKLKAEWAKQAKDRQYKEEMAKAAGKAKESTSKMMDAFKNINSILGDRGSLSTEKTDENIYQQIKEQLNAAWGHAKDAGNSITEFVSIAMDALTHKATPYFNRWVDEEVSENYNEDNQTQKKESDNATDNVVRDESRETAEGDDQRRSGSESTQDVSGAEKISATAEVSDKSGKNDNGSILGSQGELGAQSGEQSQNQSTARGKSDRTTSKDGKKLSSDVERDTGNVFGFQRSDYTIKPGSLAREGSWKKTAANNLDAVDLYKKIISEKRPAKKKEQAILAKYVGWGASELANSLFPGYAQSGKINMYQVKSDWKDLVERVEKALTPEELKTAARSTQYAHYTSESVVRSIYKALNKMGFTGGKILEPGMGVGNFIGLLPAKMRKNSVYTGVEMDHVSAGIAKLLYPNQNIMQADFIKQKFPPNFFDAAIGNPPFGSTKILADPEYRSQRFSLHNYFFAKTIDRVKPGGLLVFVTSRYTMDSKTDKARKYIADRADLLGAIRLPQTAFLKSAGTEVVTDVLFLQKREKDSEQGGQPWTGQGEVIIGEETAQINEYFVKHPEMVLGEHSMQGSMYSGNEYTVKAIEGDIEDHFAKAAKKLPSKVYQKTSGKIKAKFKEKAVIERDFNPENKKEGGLYIKDGHLMKVDFGSGVPLTDFYKAPKKTVAFLKGYLKLRDALKLSHKAQLEDGEWKKALEVLNKEYDQFAKKHGNILAFTTTYRTKENEDGEKEKIVYRKYKNEKALSQDVESPLVMTLERITDDGKIIKTPVLKDRTINKPIKPEIKTIPDALAVSLDSIGQLDIDHVAETANKPKDEIIAVLGDLIYENPDGSGHVMADEYLSGNVVRKLEEAKAVAKLDNTFERNVTALENSQPEPLKAEHITVNPGVTWIPVKYYGKFATEALEMPKSIVTYQPIDNTYRVLPAPRTSSWDNSRRYAPQGLRSSTDEWATPNRGTNEILESVLNNRTIRITYTVRENGANKTVFDAEATAAANEIAKKIRSRFNSWVWEDAERAGDLLDIYNSKMNTIKGREFDGSHLTLPGMSQHISPYDHQKRVIWRILQSGNSYLGHAVGSGKTLAMISAGMEMRRLGMINKPLYVVPKHMLGQFAQEFQSFYPMANIMVADEKNFHTENRKRFVAQAALNNPDAIILTHTSFGLLRVQEGTLAPVRDEFLEQMRFALDEMKEDDEPRMKIKRMEKRIEAAEQRFDSLISGGDNVVSFEELGTDFLFLDEAHEFRKLDFVTNRQMKGIDPQGSKRAIDLYIKTLWLEKQNPGRSHVFASGTPITNTLGELFSLMRFFDQGTMEEDGMNHFDSWANLFGEPSTDYEMNSAGKYEPVERFSKFVNMPELMSRVRQFMDVLTSSQLGTRVVRPDIKGGVPEIVLAPQNAALKDYQDNVLQPRIKASREWKPSKNQPGNPDPIINIITDGRLASIDMRFVDPNVKNDPDSKLNHYIDGIIEAYRESQDNKYAMSYGSNKQSLVKGGSQVCFYNSGFGKSVTKRRGFDSKAWLMKRLKKAGVNLKHVAWIDDYSTAPQKEALFKDVRDGKKRILLGSAKKMGTGMNVQNRLSHLNYLDAPWYPADVEQPDGRIVRQANQNKIVSLKRYATKGSYDATMWQMVARKSKFIEQAFIGDKNVRSIEDVSETSQYEMAAAIASGDERVVALVALRADIERLTLLQGSHSSGQITLSRDKRTFENDIANMGGWLEDFKEIESLLPAYIGTEIEGKVGRTVFEKRKDFGVALIKKIKAVFKKKVNGTYYIGTINGVDIEVDFDKGTMFHSPSINAHVSIKEIPFDIAKSFVSEDDVKNIDPGGFVTKVINTINKIPSIKSRIEGNLSENHKKLERIKKKLGAPYEHAKELNEKIAEAANLERELAQEGEEVPEQETRHPDIGAAGFSQQKLDDASLPGSNKAKFSTTDDLNIFKPNKKDVNNFKKQIDDFLRGKLNTGDILTIGETPEVIKAIGGNQLPVTISQRVLHKVVYGSHKNELYIKDIESLPFKLADPIAIFESTDPKARGSIVLMLEMRTKQGNTVIVPIYLNSKQGRYSVNSIGSVFGKESKTWFDHHVKKNLLYINQNKSRLWGMTGGPKLSKVRGSKNDSGKRILTEKDIVKKKYSTDQLPGEGVNLADIQKRFTGQHVFKSPDGHISIRLQNGTGLRIKSVKQMSEGDYLFAIETGRMDKKGVILGKYKNKEISLHKDLASNFTLDHELKHFLDDIGIITQSDQLVLDSKFNAMKKRGELRFKASDNRDENRANFFAQLLEDREQYRDTTIGRILQKIADFIDALVHIGRSSVRKVAKEVESGKIFSRKDSKKSSGKGKYQVSTDLEYEAAEDTIFQQIMDFFVGVLKYRKDKGEGHREDVSTLAHNLQSTMYNANKVGGAAKRAFNVFRKQTDWKFEKQNELLFDGDHSLQGVLEQYWKEDRAGYKKLNNYFVQKDVAAKGHIVRELKDEEGFQLVHWKKKNGKEIKLGIFETEDEAWAASREYEARESGLDERGQEALKTARFITRKLYLHYAQEMQKAIEAYKKANMPIPEITTVRDGKTVQIDLETLSRQLGDRQGYYFPRLRQSGQYRVSGKKEGRKEHKYFDSKLLAHAYRAGLERKGYETEFTKVGKLTEDIYQALEPLLSLQQTINKTLKDMSNKDKERVLEDRNLLAEWEGNNLIIRGNGKSAGVGVEVEEILKPLGGEYQDRFKYSNKGRKIYIPQIVFSNVEAKDAQTLEDNITKAVLYSGHLFKDMDVQFATAFAKQFDAVLKSRGSRARMIGRSDARGEDVPRGYEEDLLTTLIQTANAAAGGYAKGRIAQEATAAITGRDISWEDFKESHDDGTIEDLQAELDSMRLSSPADIEKKKIYQEKQRKLRASLMHQKFITLDEVEQVQEDLAILQKKINKLSKFSNQNEAKILQAKITAARTGLFEKYQKIVKDRSIQADKQAVIYKEINATLKDILRNEEAADRVIGTLKGLAVWKYLGFRVSSAAVNVTNMITGVPAAINGETDDQVSLTSALKHVGIGLKEYGKSRFGNSKYQDLYDEIHKRGFDEPKFNTEAFNVLQSKLGRGWSTILEKSMILFGATERMNRASTIAGAYLAMKENYDGAWEHEAMLMKAREISDFAHGLYEKSNRPYHMRGDNIGARTLQMAYVFQTFTHNYIQEIIRLGLDKRQAKAALYMAFSPAIFGVGSTIPIGLVKAISNALGGDDPEEKIIQVMEDNFGMGKFARYGITGIGDHGISLKGSLATRFGTPDSFMDIFGAPGSVVGDIWEGGKNISKGYYREGFEKVAPAAFGNVSRGFREASEGVTTRSGAPIYFGKEQIKGDTIDTILRMLSFNPTHVSEKREIQWNEYKTIEKYRNRKQELFKKLKRFYNKSQSARKRSELLKIYADMRDFNKEIRRKRFERLVPLITKKTRNTALKRISKPSKRERERKL